VSYWHRAPDPFIIVVVLPDVFYFNFCKRDHNCSLKHFIVAALRSFSDHSNICVIVFVSDDCPLPLELKFIVVICLFVLQFFIF
jgi:hypothetical protein